MVLVLVLVLVAGCVQYFSIVYHSTTVVRSTTSTAAVALPVRSYPLYEASSGTVVVLVVVVQ